MNIETAEHMRDEMSFDRCDVICPLLQNRCDPRCECIVKPTIFNRSGPVAGIRKVEDATTYNDSHAWEVSKWACGNAMFSGERYEQNTN